MIKPWRTPGMKSRTEFLRRPAALDPVRDIDRMLIAAKGAIIRGEITATPDQVALALAFVEPMVSG